MTEAVERAKMNRLSVESRGYRMSLSVVVMDDAGVRIASQ